MCQWIYIVFSLALLSHTTEYSPWKWGKGVGMSGAWCNTSHTPAFGGSGKQVVPVGMAYLRKILSSAIPTDGLALWGAPCPSLHHQTLLVLAHRWSPPGVSLRRGGVRLPLRRSMVAIGGRMLRVPVGPLRVLVELWGNYGLNRRVMCQSRCLHRRVQCLCWRVGGCAVVRHL